MLQVNLKLSLNKIKFGIGVSYNTYEKATFDQYLVASIALRSTTKIQAYKYINDITGDGSLNNYFKGLYEQVKSLKKKQLEDIMNNSMYPMLRIDKSNTFDYYPELDVSVYRNKVFTGFFGKYSDLIEKLQISEKVIEHEVYEISNKNNAEPFNIEFNNDEIKVKIADEWINIPDKVFKKVLVNDLNSINKYEGMIHKGVEGQGWFTLTNSVINNMYSSNNFFYDDGDHCLIRSDDVRKTIVSSIAGFYIYKEESIPYTNNRELCEKVLELLYNNGSINEFKTKALINLLNSATDVTAQKVINYILDRKESKELSLFGISLLVRGLEKNWSEESLKSFMTFSDPSLYNLIYKCKPTIFNDIEKLYRINYENLIEEHKEVVDKYKNDKDTKISIITAISGELTASGMREKVKQLKASNDTKAFSKLANDYIGHCKFNYNECTLDELDKHLKNLNKMHNLMKILSIQLQDLGK